MAASNKNGLKQSFTFDQEAAKKVARPQKEKLATKVIPQDQILVGTQDR